MSEPVKILYQGGTDEIEVKKSRFIAHTLPIQEEKEALDAIADIKKEYWDARHNCYAYTTGDRFQLQRFSDDGEPSGTAGKPILEVLLNEKIHNCLVIVTRYFGGTLLGTGGLIRAYQGAAKAGLEKSLVLDRQDGWLYTISCDYSSSGRVQYLLASKEIPVIGSRYTEEVSMDIALTAENEKEILDALTDATSGTVLTEKKQEIRFAAFKKEIILL